MQIIAKFGKKIQDQPIPMIQNPSRKKKKGYAFKSKDEEKG